MIGINKHCHVWRGWLGVLTLWAGMVCAAEPVLDVTQTRQEALSLTSHFAVLQDPSAALTLAEVTQPAMAQAFKTGQGSGEALGFSYTRSAVWLRLHLRNPSDQPVERVLEIAYALLARVDFHQPTAGQGYRTVQVGYARPMSAQPHPSRFIVLPVSMPAHADQLVYLRVETPNSLNIPARLWEPKAFQAHERSDYALQALYFGVVIAIGFYNLMLFFALRDLSYLLYVVFAGCVALALAAFTGLGVAFIWGDRPAWSMMGVNVPSAAAAVAILLFTRRVLTTQALVPRLDFLIKLFIGVNAMSFFVLMGWFRAFTPFFVIINAVTALFLLIVGVVCATKRRRSAYFFVAAFFTILLAVALTHLRNLGVLPTNVFTSDGTQIGSALEMLLLSFALADRYNAFRREKVEAQAQALQAQGQLVESLKASEQLLETRVQERTAELRLLNARLEAISITDGLTGVANRRRFDAMLANEWARAARLNQSLAIGLMDVDWFKQYNDHYGHQAGDECLRQVARLLAENIGRTGDLVARYGGEEFVFIAPATNGEAALDMARRVCQSLRALEIAHALSAFGCVTASIGVAAVSPADGNTPDELLRAADRALYAAKEQGRNQAILANEI
jgi:diguanylate cyclase (GGDEF)-like protein